jgi:hypothetical protein
MALLAFTVDNLQQPTEASDPQNLQQFQIGVLGFCLQKRQLSRNRMFFSDPMARFTETLPFR